MYALSAMNGELLWKYPSTGAIGEVISSPAVVPFTNPGCNGLKVSEVVYFGSLDNNVYALASNGDPLWNYTTGNQVGSSPVVVDGILYVGSLDDNVYALNAFGLTNEWQYATGRYVGSSPAVYNGAVYVGSADDNLYAFNANAVGGKVWSQGVCGQIGFSPVAAANNAVYVVDQTGCLSDFALFPFTGELNWQSLVSSWGLLGLAESNGVVYAGDGNGELFAIDAINSNELWSVFPCQVQPNCQGAYLSSSPAVANGVVYVAGQAFGPIWVGFVAAVDAATGAVLWSFPFPSNVVASPTVVNGVLYIQAQTGYMYAFGLPDPPQSPARPELRALRHVER